MTRNKFIIFQINETIKPEEWHRIDIFKERAEEFIASLRKLRIGSITGSFKRKENGTYLGSLTIPPINSFKGLYIELRLLYAVGEPSNYKNIANIIAKRSGNSIIQKFMGHLVRSARSSLVEDGFFNIKGRPISGEKLIDLWFNAKIFHSDDQKRKELGKMTALLSDEGNKSLFFLAVYDAGIAIKNLYFIIKDMSPDNMTVPIPVAFVNGLKNE